MIRKQISINKAFPNGYEIEKLHSELELAELSIDGINVSGDDMEIIFHHEIDGALFDSILASHTSEKRVRFISQGSQTIIEDKELELAATVFHQTGGVFFAPDFLVEENFSQAIVYACGLIEAEGDYNFILTEKKLNGVASEISKVVTVSCTKDGAQMIEVYSSEPLCHGRNIYELNIKGAGHVRLKYVTMALLSQK